MCKWFQEHVYFHLDMKTSVTGFQNFSQGQEACKKFIIIARTLEDLICFSMIICFFSNNEVTELLSLWE